MIFQTCRLLADRTAATGRRHYRAAFQPGKALQYRTGSLNFRFQQAASALAIGASRAEMSECAKL